MRKSLAALGPVALGCLAMTCAACASGPRHGPGGSGAGPGGPEGGPPTAPGLFVSPFGEPFRSEPGEPYPVAAWFAGADADHDGKLTRAEFMADGLRWFGRLDTNGDGVIGTAEIVAYEAMTGQLTAGMRGPGGPGGGPGGGGRGGRPGGPGGASLADNAQANVQDGGMGMPGGGMGGQGGGPGGGRGGRGGGTGEGQRSGGPRGGGAATSILAMAGLLNVPEPVKAADVDTNQRITPEEWSRAGDRWFDLLDTDKDGVLTLAELPQTQLQQRGGRGMTGGRRGPPR